MEYKLNFTKEFLQELEKICTYISFNLNNPIASLNLRKEIIKNSNLLKRFPNMFPKIKNINRVKYKYRRIVINNYIILYTIDDENKIIYYAHIYYNESNYMKII